MQLQTFSDKAPANSINAKDLDANFRRLRPIPQDGSPRHYSLNETPDGWSIRVLPNFPSSSDPCFLAIANGTLYWTGSGVDEPEEPITPISEAPEDGKTYGRLNKEWSELVVVPPPPSSGIHVLGVNSGTLQWIQTEACST